MIIKKTFRVGLATSSERVGNAACAYKNHVSVLSDHRLALIVCPEFEEDHKDLSARVPLVVPSPEGLGSPCAHAWCSDGSLLVLAFGTKLVFCSKGSRVTLLEGLDTVLQADLAFVVRDVSCYRSEEDCSLYLVAAAGSRGVKILFVRNDSGRWCSDAGGVFLAQSYSICTVLFSCHSRWLFLGANDGHVGVWDGKQLCDGSRQQTAVWRDVLNCKGGRLTDACFNSDENVLCLAAWKQGIFVYGVDEFSSSKSKFRLLACLGNKNGAHSPATESCPFLCTVATNSNMLAYSCGTNVYLVQISPQHVFQVSQVGIANVTGLAWLEDNLFAMNQLGEYHMLSLENVFASKQQSCESPSGGRVVVTCAGKMLHFHWELTNTWHSVFADLDAFAFFPKSGRRNQLTGLMVRWRQIENASTVKVTCCFVEIAESAILPSQPLEFSLDFDQTIDEKTLLTLGPVDPDNVGLYYQDSNGHSVLCKTFSVDEAKF